MRSSDPAAGHVWDHRTITAVRSLRARAVIGQRELDDRPREVEAWTTEQLASELRDLCATYAIEIEATDLELQRDENVRIGGELWTMQWRPQTHLLRLVGGEADGLELTHDGFPNPILLQVDNSTGSVAASPQLLFELAGWCEPDHVWIYDLSSTS